MKLQDKVAVVTGAASGIGLASTEAMLAAGSRVVMVDRDEAALKALVRDWYQLANDEITDQSTYTDKGIDFIY